MNGSVLCVDDDPVNILLIQRIFRQALPGVQLHTASTGDDGVTEAGRIRPDLILLDNRLPGTNGQQVLRRLAASPAAAAIPVVIFSGDTSPVTVRALLAAGAADFLAKPFDIRQLLEVIERYLPG